MQHVKQSSEDETSRAIKVYNALPNKHKPACLLRVSPIALQYEWVEGDSARHWISIHAVAQKYLWGKPTAHVQMHGRIQYYTYVWCQGKNAGGIPMWVLNLALNPILTDELVSANEVHGDLTFENVVVTEDSRIVFIDPGQHRGLKCRELDESKLMQSMDGFNEVYYGWDPPPAQDVFHARRVHWALLASHYIRMLRHVNKDACDYARQRIEEIARAMGPATSDDHDRFRRCDCKEQRAGR